MRRALALLPLLASIWPLAATPAQGDVRIYRCTDAAGRQSLRDTPCPKGQAQQARDMLRPKDAPRALHRPAPPPAPATAPAPVRLVVLAPPQPMYECVTPDGARYTSDNGSGNPRWVPFWTLGYPAYGDPWSDARRGRFRPAPSGNAGIGRPLHPAPTPLAPPPTGWHPAPWTVASGGGTWVSDSCAMLPPADTCARLRERRDAIRTRAFNAMPSERDTLRREERALAARLDNDCNAR